MGYQRSHCFADDAELALYGRFDNDIVGVIVEGFVGEDVLDDIYVVQDVMGEGLSFRFHRRGSWFRQEICGKMGFRWRGQLLSQRVG